jgi:hypothetical protein
MPPQLPYELWLRILESLTHEEHFARTAYVNIFVNSIIKRTATEQDLVTAFPEFERRAWKATRPYYAINSEIRKAAQQVFLSGVLLQTCSAPLEEVPRKRKGKRRARGTKSVVGACEDEGPFYVPDVLARMRCQPVEGSDSAMVPTYLPLEVFGSLVTAPLKRPPSLGRAAAQALRLECSFDNHVWRILEERELLHTVRTVELLAASPYASSEKDEDEAWSLAEALKRYIERTWKDIGVEGGEVRVMY